jgi:hypothetical protein
MKYTWLLLLAACSGSEEAARIDLPVTTDETMPAPAATDLSYSVDIDRVRIAVADIELTIEGEEHQDDARIVAPHPGHEGGGEVTGELPGNFILEWDGSPHPLGDATLIVGDYHGANWTFRGADAADGLATDDPLVGHAFHVEGVASKAGIDYPFDIVLDVEAGTRLVGAVFEDVVTASTSGSLAVQFFPTDPYEGDTAFDGVDFAALPEVAGVRQIRPGTTEHNALRRIIQTHDFYGVTEQ